MIVNVVDRRHRPASGHRRLRRGRQDGHRPQAAPNGTYQDAAGNYHYVATFAGFVPAEDPQLSIIVVIDEPSGQHYAGRVGAGLRRAAQYGLRQFRIPPPAAPLRLDGAAPTAAEGRSSPRRRPGRCGASRRDHHDHVHHPHPHDDHHAHHRPGTPTGRCVSPPCSPTPVWPHPPRWWAPASASRSADVTWTRRSVTPGALFCCVAGPGRRPRPGAEPRPVRSPCSPSAVTVPDGAAVCSVPDVRAAMGPIAAALWGTRRAA